jgi:ribonuclease BN (tRNA processing enzyme)
MLLGTAGWMPTDSRDTACVYLRQGDRVLLFDAGTGARHLLNSPDLIRGVTRIDVCLSHFHLDHLIGLSYLPGLPSEIELVVWGPGKALYETSPPASPAMRASPSSRSSISILASATRPGSSSSALPSSPKHGWAETS